MQVLCGLNKLQCVWTAGWGVRCAAVFCSCKKVQWWRCKRQVLCSCGWRWCGVQDSWVCTECEGHRVDQLSLFRVTIMFRLYPALGPAGLQRASPCARQPIWGGGGAQLTLISWGGTTSSLQWTDRGLRWPPTRVWQHPSANACRRHPWSTKLLQRCATCHSCHRAHAATSACS